MNNGIAVSVGRCQYENGAGDFFLFFGLFGFSFGAMGFHVSHADPNTLENCQHEAELLFCTTRERYISEIVLYRGPFF